MRALITGAAGFLGSHLTDALIAEGHTVLGADNLCTGSMKNLEHLKREPRFEFLEQDICQPFDPGHVDYVFNFASPASPVDYSRLGIETLMVGSAGTKNTLDLQKRSGCKVSARIHVRVLWGSNRASSEFEEYWGHVNPIGPRSVYNEAKRFSRGDGHGISPLPWR